MPSAAQRTNRLAREKSPYLLQHQHNPVGWFAWGDAAFARARRENKPIFLSIGYSTCHWCHVMERESFEDEATARMLNEHFVSIKVDREERPDVDKIYMTFVQAMTSQGGWPLNVFLAPDLKPFYGGTYWPPEPRFGRPSFQQVLQSVAGAWQTNRDQIVAQSAEMHRRLVEATTQESTSAILHPSVVTQAGRALQQGFDPVFGGWGTAPKFPTPSLPSFLLGYGVRHDDRNAVKMVLLTCDRMAAGGIYDQLGGGFARYSVDQQWLVPHFEKMLYDNAQLLSVYLDAYLVSGEARHAGVARDIIRYVLRDMTHPGGGFYSAEDADSEGKEGKFYCWTRAELSSLLTPEEFNVAVSYFGVTEEGNFVDHSDPDPLPKQNVLSVAQTDLPSADAALLDSAKTKMFAARARRVRPHLDDKILASWNGLMLAALAKSYAVFGDASFRTAAERNLQFLRDKLWDDSTRTLYHRWRDGERDTAQLLDAYAFLLLGVIELYQATLDPRQLEFAVALAEAMLAKFYDAKEGGFWQAPAGTSDLILRVKEDYDGAEPSGNSVAILALLKLGAITERQEFSDAAGKSLRLFAQRLQQQPQAVPLMLAALDFSLTPPQRIVLAGSPDAPETRALLRTAHGVFQPHKVVLGTAGPVEALARTLEPKGAAATAYVCVGTACLPPINDPGKLKESLQAKRGD
jgi:uncharacterized protein YyaL (SSP411 family)